MWTTSLFFAQVQAHFISSGTRSAQVYPDKFVSQPFFAKQGRGQGPRTVALRANPSSLYRGLTRRAIIVIVIEKGKREFMMFACVCVEGKGRGRGGEGGVEVRCAVLCLWTLCLWCVCGVCDV